MNRYVCIHGHFYQPPRENAWLEEVELQDSAYPYHDWNERITAECYAPNAASRILDSDKRILDIVNNYSRISFNFGPTLLSWMERHAPEVHQAIIDADLESRERFSGHGSAIAQVYNHMIMPLANLRDKRTQVIWGIRDFEHRFRRKPEGMWLSETAVDLETLDILAEYGIGFTILSPGQAGRVREPGEEWEDVTAGRVNPRQPYLCALPSGRTISLFFYDGPIARDLAFRGLLSDGESFAGRLTGAFDDTDESPQLVHVATDGETYGHHHRFGDMALAFGLHHIAVNEVTEITVYGEFLEKFPPRCEVEMIEDTSWSCIHGIERWRSNCGCNSGRQEWTQEWRSPLREALDWLRDELAPFFEREAGALLRSPWEARDDYISVILDRSRDNVEAFFTRHATRDLSREEKSRALGLLEIQRQAMLMYTSCGWFFDEISGIETTQVLQYAARAIQLAGLTGGPSLEPRFVELLKKAPSNTIDNGGLVYETYVRPAMVDLLRVGAHYAISSLFEDYADVEAVYCYTAERAVYSRHETGRQKLAVGRARMHSNITWEEQMLSFAVVHLGDHNLVGGVRQFKSEELFVEMQGEVEQCFARSDVPEVIRLLDKHFETHNYSLWHLFRDEQRRVFGRILEATLEEVKGSFRRIYDHHYPIMQVMRDLRTPIPKALATTAEFTLNSDLRRTLEADMLDLDEMAGLVTALAQWSFELDRTTLEFIAEQRVVGLMQRFAVDPDDLHLLRTVEGLLRVLMPLNLDLDLWKAQNVYFAVARRLYSLMQGRSASGDEFAREWLEAFEGLSYHLKVRTV